MHKFKKNYEAPDLNVSRVEVESSICGGSVDFGDREKPIVIDDQAFNPGTENDFSGQAWDMDNNSNL